MTILEINLNSKNLTKGILSREVINIGYLGLFRNWKRELEAFDHRISEIITIT